MEIVLVILAFFALVVLCFIFLTKPGKRKTAGSMTIPDSYKQHLIEKVQFYNNLDEIGKTSFETRMMRFLSRVRIVGIGTEVEDLDRVFIGASAIIPIFNFDRWEYVNLNEVMVYPETFNTEFEQKGSDRSVMGMVGEGAMQQVMIISQPALRQGFANQSDKHNTAIHEFVHLIDKTDGEVDGIPELLLRHRYIMPWLEMMLKNIRQIRKNDSDINPYGATNQAEFFAVAAEYFFERPDLLERKHPELYGMLAKMFGKTLNSTS
ncbi:MAG: zinc-dependent peptidase [Chitinophagaceae bacterium]|nr:zinc-dependent peptidase [Chitinophagaceae bacterium]